MSRWLLVVILDKNTLQDIVALLKKEVIKTLGYEARLSLLTILIGSSRRDSD